MNPVDVASVNIHAAKTHLSRLVDQAAAGWDVIIARAGRPVARLVALETRPARRVLGRLSGRLQVPDDLDAPLPDEMLAAFEETVRLLTVDRSLAPCSELVVLVG